MDEFEIVEFIFWIVIIIIGVIGKFINRTKNRIKQKRKQSEIYFDEFDDIEKIKQQEINDMQELEYEYQVLNQEYNLLDSVEVEEENIAEGNPINALRENGYNFDIGLFKKWSTQIFGCIKSGTEEQLKIIKQFMSENLYARLEKQIKLFKKDGLEFVTEDLVIEKCNIYDYGKSMSKEEIKILINATMKEYILQKDTNKILRGSNKKSYNKNIIMTFEKQNVEGNEGLIHNCPNCGAEVAQTEFGKCRYCSTLVVPIRYNWTLTKFETL